MVPTDNKIEEKEEKQVPPPKKKKKIDGSKTNKQAKKTQNIQKEKRIQYIEVKFIKIGKKSL